MKVTASPQGLFTPLTRSGGLEVRRSGGQEVRRSGGQEVRESAVTHHNPEEVLGGEERGGVRRRGERRC